MEFNCVLMLTQIEVKRSSPNPCLWGELPIVIGTSRDPLELAQCSSLNVSSDDDKSRDRLSPFSSSRSRASSEGATTRTAIGATKCKTPQTFNKNGPPRYSVLSLRSSSMETCEFRHFYLKC
jgi:hypothetical protein